MAASGKSAAEQPGLAPAAAIGPILTHFGRRQIYTPHPFVTDENLLEILQSALPAFNCNRSDTRYLYNYYRGEQPILYREKEVRPEITHNTVVNYANEIVSFKTAYLLGEPMQYVSASDKEGEGIPEVVTRINRLNAYMRAAGKAARDKELADWAHICGVGYRLCLPNSERRDESESPFNIYTLDPRLTFVVRYAGVDHHLVLACNVVPRGDLPEILSIYARGEGRTVIHYEFECPGALFLPYAGSGLPVTGPKFDGWRESAAFKREVLDLPEVPVTEYICNSAHMGAFEVVLGQLDEINVLTSTRTEAVDQFVQSLWVFQNCKISSDQLAQAQAGKALMITSEGTNGQESKVYAVSVDLNQNGVQEAVNDARGAMLNIVGMPSTQNGSASTSDTGSAVIMRDGWTQAESRAKDTETLFKQSEFEFLKNVLYICRFTDDLDVKLYEIEPKLNRRNYADLLTRVQSLTTMLSSDKIAPQLAFEHCGLFTDPEAAFAISQRYHDAVMKQAEAEQAKEQNKKQEENVISVPETVQGASA